MNEIRWFAFFIDDVLLLFFKCLFFFLFCSLLGCDCKRCIWLLDCVFFLHWVDYFCFISFRNVYKACVYDVWHCKISMAVRTNIFSPSCSNSFSLEFLSFSCCSGNRIVYLYASLRPIIIGQNIVLFNVSQEVTKFCCLYLQLYPYPYIYTYTYLFIHIPYILYILLNITN